MVSRFEMIRCHDQSKLIAAMMKLLGSSLSSMVPRKLGIVTNHQSDSLYIIRFAIREYNIKGN